MSTSFLYQQQFEMEKIYYNPTWAVHLPEDGVILLASTPSWVGKLWEACVPEFSTWSPISEISHLTDLMGFFTCIFLWPLTSWENSDEIFSISPATRLRLSHRILQDGEYKTLLCKGSAGAWVGMFRSLAATQQADPMATQLQLQSRSCFLCWQ